VKNDFAAGASFPNGFSTSPPQNSSSSSLIITYFHIIFLDFYLVDVRRFSFPWCYFNFVTACPRPALLSEKK
jgi:hypothetical protein